MNYELIYKQLTSVDTTNSNYELHHITPKCIGGNDFSDNLVKLSYRAHYIAHKLLTKIHPNNKKIVGAFVLMSFKNKSKYYNSRDFELARQIQSNRMKINNPMHNDEIRSKMSTSMKKKYLNGWNPRVDKLHTDESKFKISNSRKGKCVGKDHHNFGGILSEETKQKISIARLKNDEIYRKPRSEEVKAKISASKKGKTKSEETKRKISESKKSLPFVTCPHCNKTMQQSPGAIRWHFDNCRNKIIS